MWHLRFITANIAVKLRGRFPPPRPLHDHQCPWDQPVSLVKQHRRTTPVPTLHPQSLSTLDHHRRDLVFPGWIRQHAYIRLRGGSPAEGVLQSRKEGRRARSTLGLEVSFSSSPTILHRGLVRRPSIEDSRSCPFTSNCSSAHRIAETVLWHLEFFSSFLRAHLPFPLKAQVQSSPLNTYIPRGVALKSSLKDTARSERLISFRCFPDPVSWYTCLLDVRGKVCRLWMVTISREQEVLLSHHLIKTCRHTLTNLLPICGEISKHGRGWGARVQRRLFWLEQRQGNHTTLRCSVQMTTASSSSATSCCEYGVLNRQVEARHLRKNHSGLLFTWISKWVGKWT